MLLYICIWIMMYLFLREKKWFKFLVLAFHQTKHTWNLHLRTTAFSRPATLRVVCVQRTQGQFSHVRQVNCRYITNRVYTFNTPTTDTWSLKMALQLRSFTLRCFNVCCLSLWWYHYNNKETWKISFSFDWYVTVSVFKLANFSSEWTSLSYKLMDIIS